MADVRKKTVTIVDSLASSTYTTCAEQIAYKWMLVFETCDYIQLRNCALLPFMDPHLLIVNSLCLIYMSAPTRDCYNEISDRHILKQIWYTAIIHIQNL